MTGVNSKHDREVEALVLGAPAFLIVRFGSLTCCLQASVAGALALSALGIPAKAELCAVAISDRENQASIGHSLRSFYDFAWGDAEHARGMTFEEWAAMQEAPKRPYPLHAVIRTDRAIVDLTLGQICARSPVHVPSALSTEAKPGEWPSARLYCNDVPGVRLDYVACPYPERAPAWWRDMAAAEHPPVDGLKEDLLHAMRIVKRLKYDRARVAEYFKGCMWADVPIEVAREAEWRLS